MAFYYRFLKILLNKVLNIIKHMAKEKASKEEKKRKKKKKDPLCTKAFSFSLIVLLQPFFVYGVY